MWNQIRNPPFVQRGQHGEVSYFHGSSQVRSLYECKNTQQVNIKNDLLEKFKLLCLGCVFDSLVEEVVGRREPWSSG